MSRLRYGVLQLGVAMSLVGGVAATQAAAQTVTLSVPPGTSIAEGAGSLDVTGTATLSTARTSATSITLSLAGTARTTDYAVLSLPDITIPAGDTTRAVTLVLSPVDTATGRGPRPSR